jgi:UDP-N-acetylmuramyl pentapeptide phosphotransferase/UDP-N-acetylglucosamine-1-phosphate transferase
MIAQNMWLWGQIAALAFFGSLAISGFMATAGLGDASDGRSAHKGTIPTAGGVGYLAGIGLSLCAVALIFPDLSLPIGFASVLALVFAIGVLGLVDDALTLGPKVKFGLMLLVCGAAASLIGPPRTLPFIGTPLDIFPVFGLTGAMLWIFVVMNAVNFMDGANGMMGITMMIANVGLFGAALVGDSVAAQLLSGLSLMALLGFLPYNFRRKARVFAGDVGSLSLGFLFAVTALFLIADTPDATFHLVGPVLILPLLGDVLLTLIRRARTRENLLKSHNTHLYQRLIQSGFGHLTVSWFYGLTSLFCANIVVFGVTKGWFNTIHISLILVGSVVAAYFLISRGLSARRLANPRDNEAS